MEHVRSDAVSRRRMPAGPGPRDRPFFARLMANVRSQMRLRWYRLGARVRRRRNRPFVIAGAIAAGVLVFVLVRTPSLAGRWVAGFPSGDQGITVELVLRDTGDGVDGSGAWRAHDATPLAFVVRGFQTGDDVSLEFLSETGFRPILVVTFQGTRGPADTLTGALIPASAGAVQLPPDDQTIVFQRLN